MPVLFRILSVVFLAVSPAYAGTITVDNAWINEAPPTVKILAGYVTISNSGPEPVELISVHGPSFEKIEFHNTQITDGVASMIKQDVIKIPAGSEFSFSPGGMHLMLFNKQIPLKNGDKIMLDFTFSNNVSMPVEFELRRGDTHEHHHH